MVWTMEGGVGVGEVMLQYLGLAAVVDKYSWDEKVD